MRKLSETADNFRRAFRKLIELDHRVEDLEHQVEDCEHQVEELYLELIEGNKKKECWRMKTIRICLVLPNAKGGESLYDLVRIKVNEAIIDQVREAVLTQATCNEKKE